jgi:hypothetical protein
MYSPQELVQALLSEPTLQFKDRGEYLREGICPECGKKELYVRKSTPFMISCSREGACGGRFPVKELLPDMFENFTKRFPATEKNPHATADAYLAEARGFNLERIKGFYTQEICHLRETGEYIPTVRFYLDKEKTRYWERLIGKTGKDGRKAHNGGKRKPDGTMFRGDAWSPPGMVLNPGETCFITEGIFDAISLLHVGKKAVSALSSTNFIFNFIEKYKNQDITWALAYDGDKAGRKKMLQHYKDLKAKGEKASVCLIPPGKKDLNDFFRTNKLNAAFFEKCFYEGKLFTAETITEKAWHIFKKYQTFSKIVTEFDNAIYNVELDAKKSEGEPTWMNNFEEFKVMCSVDRICNVAPKFLYIEKDEIMNEQKYVFQINYRNGSPEDLIGLEGSSIANAKAFHNALLNHTTGGQFLGKDSEFTILTKKWFDARILQVKSIPFIGYDKASKAWIFQKHAFNNGQQIEINDNGYFEIKNTGIKSSLTTVNLNTGGKFDPGWLRNFIKAFNWQGLAVLSFWFGSLFVQQIREKQETWPFLEFTGEPGAGKSTVLEFCWKLVGREDYEGFDLLKASHAGRRRAFNQLSNLPVVLIESDRDSGDRDAKIKQFNFDEYKPFYNGRGTGTLGVARRNNEVEEHLFQASLLISQNAEVDGSTALLERIVHCHADKKHHNRNGERTRTVARWFERQTCSDVSGFLTEALKNEKKILDAYFKSFEAYEKVFDEAGIEHERIQKNHAQIAAACRAMSVIFPSMTESLCSDFMQYLISRAKTRVERIMADHPIVEKFWDIFEYIEHNANRETTINHASDPAQIAINLNQFRDKAMAFGQELIDLSQLKKLLLSGCKRHKLIEANKNVWRNDIQKTIRCWVFEK